MEICQLRQKIESRWILPAICILHSKSYRKLLRNKKWVHWFDCPAPAGQAAGQQTALPSSSCTSGVTSHPVWRPEARARSAWPPWNARAPFPRCGSSLELSGLRPRRRPAWVWSGSSWTRWCALHWAAPCRLSARARWRRRSGISSSGWPSAAGSCPRWACCASPPRRCAACSSPRRGTSVERRYGRFDLHLFRIGRQAFLLGHLALFPLRPLPGRRCYLVLFLLDGVGGGRLSVFFD